jgi:hypothetical protein
MNEYKRDNWDKLETLTRVFNGVLIATLTVVIGYGTDQVAESVKYGELIRKLLTNLSIENDSGKIKRDLSLITLNRTIGDEKPQLIADMSEVICKSDSANIGEKTVAFNILKERDSTRAKSLQQSFLKNRIVSLNDTFVRKNSISMAEASPSDQDPVPNLSNLLVERNGQSQIGSSTTTVFIQTNKNRQNLAKIQNSLSAKGYLVPVVQEIDKHFQNSVRYFNPEDAAEASAIIQTMEKINPKWKCQIQLLKNTNNKVPVGHIEVWLHQ